MKLGTFIIVCILFMAILLGLALTGIIKGCQQIDESGGIKALSERIWEGKKVD